MGSDGTDTWKRKYFAALEDLEAKERAIAVADELMRHTVARLSVIGNGPHRGSTARPRPCARPRQPVSGSGDRA